MIAIKRHGQKDEYILSTVHDSSMASIRKGSSNTFKGILKIIRVEEYIENRGSVDKVAIQITSSEFLRQTIERHNKLFFHMIDLPVCNSYILFKNANNQSLHLSKLKLEVVRGLIAR